MTSGSRLPKALVPAGLAALLIAAFSLTASLSGRAQDAKPAGAASALDSLPADTSVAVWVRSLSDLERKFKASPLYSLREHPDIKKFLDELRRKIDEGLSDARTKLGFDPTEVWGLVEGEVVFAVGGLDKIFSALVASQLTGGEPDVKPGDLPLILIANGGASAAKLREKLAKVFDYVQTEGAKKDVEDFRGGKITTLSRKAGGKLGSDKDAKDAKDGLEKVFFGDLGSLLLVSISRPFLESTMANLSAPSPDSLTKSADFMATQREVRADSDVTFFLNIRPIAAAARKNFQANPMAAMGWQLIEGKILGRNLKNMATSLSLRDNGLQELLFVNNGGGADGLLGVLKGPTLPGKPNPIIPEDADTFTSMSLNIPVLYGIVKDIGTTVMSLQGGLGGGGGGGAAQMPDFEQFIEASFQVKVQQVLQALGSAIHFYQRGAPVMDNPFGNLTVALELKDEMPIKELLGKLAAMGGLQPQKYLDRDLYPLRGLEGDADGPAVGLADKLLVVGMKGDSVKEVIRRSGKGGKGVGDTPAYQGLAALVPPQVNMLTYTSPRSFRDAMKMMKEGLAMIADEIPIPDFTAAADMVAGSVGYTLWKEQGFYYEAVTPFRKGGGTVPRPAAPAEKQEKKAQN